MNNPRLVTGVVGCGAVASYGHLPSLAKHPDCELYAISEVNPVRLKDAGDKFNIPKSRRFSDYREMLKLPELELVGVATRVEQHKEVVLAAAAAGKHILCEKPVAPSLEEGWEMVKACKNAKVQLIINLHTRIKPSTLKMLEYLKAGLIGQVHTLRMVYCWYGPEDEAAPGQTLTRRDFLMEEGGGAIFDCGVHYFDMARVFTQSEFKDIQSIGSWVEKSYSNPGHVFSQCRFDNGIVGMIEESWLYTAKCKTKNVIHQMELLGSKGLISGFWDWDPTLQKYLGDKVQLFAGDRFEESIYEVGKPFDGMYHYFSQLVRTGHCEAPLATGEDGIKAMEAALISLENAKSKR